MPGEIKKIVIEIVNTGSSSAAPVTTTTNSSRGGGYSSTLTGGELEDEYAYSKFGVDDPYVNSIKNLIHPIKTAETALLGKSVFVNKAYEQVKQLIVSAVSEGFNHYTKLTEDYISDNNFNNAKKALSKVGSLASATLGGYITGGPVGMAIGVVSWTGNTMIQETTRMNNYYNTLNATNQKVEFSRVRAGLTDNGRGTEN